MGRIWHNYSDQSSVNVAYCSQLGCKVTFGTVLSVAAHAINVLPWTSPRLSLRYFIFDIDVVMQHMT